MCNITKCKKWLKIRYGRSILTSRTENDFKRKGEMKMRLFALLELMDGDAYIFVKKGDEEIYRGKVDNVPCYVYRQQVEHQEVYSDGGSLGICFELK